MFFESSSAALFVWLALVVGVPVVAGVIAGRKLRVRADERRESVGVVQGALLGLVGLLLAFGLSMAVGRYEHRRGLIVQEANAIGTSHLRAQLLAEPARSRSLGLLADYTTLAISLADDVPDRSSFREIASQMEDIQRQLWAAAGEAMSTDPEGSAPRLYVESLNDTIDVHTERVASVRNRVPGTVMIVQVVGSAIALAVLALHLTLLGRGVTSSLMAGAVVVLILFVSFDLDRPQRGLITVPFGPLSDARAAMELSPAAEGP